MRSHQHESKWYNSRWSEFVVLRKNIDKIYGSPIGPIVLPGCAILWFCTVACESEIRRITACLLSSKQILNESRFKDVLHGVRLKIGDFHCRCVGFVGGSSRLHGVRLKIGDFHCRCVGFVGGYILLCQGPQRVPWMFLLECSKALM